MSSCRLTGLLRGGRVAWMVSSSRSNIIESAAKLLLWFSIAIRRLLSPGARAGSAGAVVRRIPRAEHNGWDGVAMEYGAVMMYCMVVVR
jgi:hypothetical protein